MTILEQQELVAIENLARTQALAMLGWTRNAPGSTPRRAHVFAGRTSAGACAFALVRHLTNFGVECHTVFCGPEHRLLPVCRRQREILEAMKVAVEDSTRTTRLAELLASADADTALVDAAGDANAPGSEQDFAAAVRGASSCGMRTSIVIDEDYRPPRPAPEDTLFQPDTAPRPREQVRLLDSTAIEQYRIPGLALMENAGWRVAREAYAMLHFDPTKGPVLVVAGAGNNGGDGFCAARHLHTWGVEVEVVLVSPRAKLIDDAKANVDLAEAAGVKIRDSLTPEAAGGMIREARADAALVVDALVGTGLSGKVRGSVAAAIEILTSASTCVLAVDTPSGLDANTGEILGAALPAQKTVTFACAKPGFFLGMGRELTGELVIADISLPRALWECSDSAE
jgi:NAD(P)H-hydrate epimerase